MHRRARNPKTVGFTLVELLVVIGIIALLIGILLPALSRARAASIKIKCAANMRSIGQTMQQYANDYHGWIPRDYDPNQMVVNHNANPPIDFPHLLWAELFLPYLAPSVQIPAMPNNDNPPTAARDPILATVFAKVPVYQCPAFITPNHALDYSSNSWVEGSDDGVTINGANISQAQPMTKITLTKRPSDICYLIEANGKLPNDTYGSYDIKDHTFLAIDNGTVNASPRMMNDNRHLGDTNILFYDGHVIAKPWKVVNREDFRTF